jgi:transcriptional regulatory protein LEU3
MRQGQPQDPNQPQSTPPGSTFESHSRFHSPMDPNGAYSSREETEASESMSPRFEGSGHGGPGNDAKGSTAARNLDGFWVDAKKVDDCFGLYVLR